MIIRREKTLQNPNLIKKGNPFLNMKSRSIAIGSVLAKNIADVLKHELWLRVCVVWTPLSGFLRLANPEVLNISKETGSEYEGCLSFFDKRGLIKRSKTVTVRYFDADLDKITEKESSGWGARIILHEINNMDGVLYSEKTEKKLMSYEDYSLKIGFKG